MVAPCILRRRPVMPIRPDPRADACADTPPARPSRRPATTRDPRPIRRLAMAWFLAALAPMRAWAQPAGRHAHAHGGLEQHIGPYEVGLVVRGTTVALTILDDREQPVDAAGFGATAVVLARGNERRTIEFQPAGANRLTATIGFPFDGKFRASVTLRGPGGTLGTARFNVDPVR